MRATEGEISTRGWRFCAGLGLAVLLIGAMIAPAMAAKKAKSKKPKTVTTSAGLSPGGATTTSAVCPKDTHVTGGGFSVSPSFNPPTLAGTRSSTIESAPTPIGQWTGGSAAFLTPPIAATLSVFGRCEANTAIKALGPVIGSSTIPLGISSDMIFNCPAGAKVLTGGYAVSGPPALADPTKRGAAVLQSRRTAPNQWTITVANPSQPEGVGPVTAAGRVLCTKGGKSVSEASATTPIINDSRTTASATCGTDKKQITGGGFLISPASGVGSKPAIGLDESQPTGKTGWQVGLYELPLFNLPVGATLTTYAYCKKIK